MRETHDTRSPARAVEADGDAAGHQAASATVDLQRFELLRSALYHEDREDWYGRYSRMITFIVLLLGSSAVAAFGADHEIFGQIAGAMIAVLSGIALVWDMGGRMQAHAVLKRRFFWLMAEIERGRAPHAIMAEATLIYADEPPAMCAVNAVAHNRAGRNIYGDDFDRVALCWRQRTFRHWHAFRSLEEPRP
ncbi:hypothetical protein [Limimaricola pyoseonensis]|uniref:SMODS and SLOG-associating 2TM effector domain-containing protein n=1 Tax=Limimaricola pyoseonensis TaxID=521013 RepID=A0A1G7GRZ9_9RHOB|nr:hypothetical protein [Limimaricola pyoseonensis]SDE90925.1 hypothetical protein SAMN04488567_2900 [Limimaricola pyoseonensis]